jgi:uncharacterized protein (TIGR04222 family)
MQSLAEIEAAYLLGGPIRAKEIALFNLVRDGWLASAGQGAFTARFEEASERVPELERELLGAIAQRGVVTVPEVLALDAMALHAIDRRLSERGLLHPESRFMKLRFACLVPFYAVTFGALGLTLFSLATNKPGVVSAFITVVAFILTKSLVARLTRITAKGKAAVREIRSAALARQSTSVRGDHLSFLKDRILLSGFKAVLGTLFSPTSIVRPGAGRDQRGSGAGFGYSHVLDDQNSVFAAGGKTESES